MTIYTETSLHTFEFWSGAKSTVELLSYDELSEIESMLEELYPDGMSATELNDFFWFETDTIAEWLGYADFETMYLERTKETDE